MLALKKQHFGPDFQDGGWVDGHSDGEQRQLRMAAGPIVPQNILTMEVLQSALETQSLEKKVIKVKGVLKKGVSKLGINLFPDKDPEGLHQPESQSSCPGGSETDTQNPSPGRKSSPGEADPDCR